MATKFAVSVVLVLLACSSCTDPSAKDTQTSESSGAGAGGTNGDEDATSAAGSAGAPEQEQSGASGHAGGDACEWKYFPEPPLTAQCPACDEPVGCERAEFIDNDDGTVTSSCCGLVWEQASTRTAYDLDEATARCEELSLAGGGWRLPTIAELFTLVRLDQDPIAPTIDRDAFPSTFWDKMHWSSTPIASYYWYVYFGNGGYGYGGPGGLNYVRCVR